LPWYGAGPATFLIQPEEKSLSLENDPQLKRNLKRAGVAAAGVLCAILVIGAYTRFVQADDVKSWTGEAEIPTVALISPTSREGGQALVLPGTLQAYYDARLYSRVPGYVHAWYKDIGARVKKGDVLASIDTPELDQQISQARADLGAAVSAKQLSGTTAARWNALLPLDAVSKQDVEDKDQDLASKTGAANASRANLDRLLAMKSFAQIVAPFDGVVTRRTADVGALVSAGPASNGEPLFAVADMHILRVYVNVPQSYSAQIVSGMTVSLSVPEYPGRNFPARLVSNSGAISAQTGTLLVEFEADNSAGLLKPGSFANVSMRLPGRDVALRLPASALMFRAEGLRVATVAANDTVVMKPIGIQADLGTQVIVASGLSPRDRVIDNPPDSLTNGDKVRVSHAD
jgi:RND family efflux transporter MFP subunit